MERTLILRVVFLLSALCPASAADDTSSLHANKTLPRSTSATEKLTVRSEYVELGTTVTLNCTSRKIAWEDMIYIIWKIHLNSRDKECIIAVGKNDSDHDTCQDGKQQKHTTNGTYHLIIPNFSLQDEGSYTCDISYLTGGSLEIIKLTAFARPHLSGWLVSEHGHTVAVCEAKSKLAASIRWETPWNSSSLTINEDTSTGQLTTVISRLHLPPRAPHTNLTCEAISGDLKHTKTRFSSFALKDPHVRWPLILVGVCASCSVVALLTGLYIMRKSLKPPSIFRKICCEPNIPAMTEEKPQQPHDPEEVQPYASYVQRVNSIYNSSAELFNA